MSDKSWGRDELRLAQEAWERGSTASTIAGQLPRRTRNAVIGMARRQGWIHPGRQSARETPLATELLADLPNFREPVTIKVLAAWFGEEPSRVASAVRQLFLSGQVQIGVAP